MHLVQALEVIKSFEKFTVGQHAGRGQGTRIADRGLFVINKDFEGIFKSFVVCVA